MCFPPHKGKSPKCKCCSFLLLRGGPLFPNSILVFFVENSENSIIFEGLLVGTGVTNSSLLFPKGAGLEGRVKAFLGVVCLGDHVF